MFTIRADFHAQVEITANLENVRRFFTDIRNFVEMMPSIEGIHTDAGGIAHWKVRAEVPLIGTFVQKFAVRLMENEEERVEWLPALGETENLLRYAADFMEKAGNLTLVNFSQNIELRRQISPRTASARRSRRRIGHQPRNDQITGGNDENFYQTCQGKIGKS